MLTLKTLQLWLTAVGKVLRGAKLLPQKMV